MADPQPGESGKRGAKALEDFCSHFNLGTPPQSLLVLSGSETGIADLLQNLKRHLSDGEAASNVKLLVAVAVASAVGSRPGVELFSTIATGAGWSRTEILDAIGAAAVIATYNGYYRFRDHVPAAEEPMFSAFRAPFGGNVFMKSSLRPFLIEGICITVSSINGCHRCVESHLKKARAAGMTDSQIDELIRVSAAVYSVAHVMNAVEGVDDDGMPY